MSVCIINCGTQIHGNAGVTSVVGLEKLTNLKGLKVDHLPLEPIRLTTLVFGTDGCRLLASVIIENGSILADWRLLFRSIKLLFATFTGCRITAAGQ